MVSIKMSVELIITFNILAGLCSWYEEWRVLDFSASVVRTAITCIAPAPRLVVGFNK